MTTTQDPNTWLFADEPSTGPSLTPTQKAILDFAAGLPDLRPEPERTDQGRYKLPHPETGKAATWTRVTNLASELDDTFNLQRWQQRNVALGLAAHPGLVVQVPGADKKALNSLCERAMWLAGGDVAAEVGTAMHKICEHFDDEQGWIRTPAHFADLPVPVYGDLTAYVKETAPLTWTEIECVVINAAVGAAGTVDRMAICPDGATRICDIKTSADMSYSWVKTAIQLATYANATHIWRGDHYEEMPEGLDKAKGYVFHLPVGAGVCTVYEVDLVAGWALAQDAYTVRTLTSAARSKGNKLASPIDLSAKSEVVEQLEATLASFGPVAEDAKAPEGVIYALDRNEWLRGRLAWVTDPQAQRYVAANWPEGAPPQGPWTNEQIDAIGKLIEPYEDSFPGPDPAAVEAAVDEKMTELKVPQHPRFWQPSDDGTKANPEYEALVASAWGELGEAQQALGAIWMRDARTTGHPFALGPDDRTLRHVTISSALVNCLAHLWDDEDPNHLTRLVLAYVVGEELPESWSTGAILGALDLDEAQRVEQIAQGFGAGDPDETALVAELALQATQEQSNQGAVQ